MAMRPWINFVQQVQEAIISCEQAQSEICTKSLFAAQKELARFATNTRVLSTVPILNEIPPILTSQAELIFSAASIQACLVDCSETDLSKVGSDAHRALESANTAMSASRLWNVVSSKSSTLNSYHQTIQDLYALSGPLQPFFPHLPELLGQNKPITYRVLLQNNKEIRPSGGFMGSYANLRVERSKLVDMNVEDIYVPDGQIKGYVPEPLAIKNYLFNGDHPGWRLRDSNWHPDFPTAAQSINWFFAEGQEVPADMLVAINLSTVEKIMDILGPIEVLDYGVSIDSKSIYAITQAQAEHNFFPGSTQKGDFLRALSDAIAQHLVAVSVKKKLEVASLLLTELNRGEILLFSQNPLLQKELVSLDYAGKLPDLECEDEECSPNVLGVIEANVGSTKANCCITRDFYNEITQSSDEFTQKLTLTFTNSSLSEPEPPYHFGGGYKNYMRLVVPKDTIISTIAVDGIPLADNAIDSELFENYALYGFLHLIEGGTTSTATITLKKPQALVKQATNLTLLKQPGILDVPWNLRLDTDHGALNQSLMLSKTTTITF